MGYIGYIEIGCQIEIGRQIHLTLLGVSDFTNLVQGIRYLELLPGVQDLALDTFEAAAAKVNQSLKLVGRMP